MGDSPALHRATCSACGAQFRVRDLERAYVCKQCGGSVRASEPASAGPDVAEACVQCSAVLPQDSRYCPECGRDTRSDRVRAGTAGAAERKLASQDLREVSRAVELVRNVLWLLAAVFALLTALPLLELRDPRVSPGEVVRNLSVPLCLLLACVLAVAHVARHPL